MMEAPCWRGKFEAGEMDDVLTESVREVRLKTGRNKARDPRSRSERRRVE